MNKVVDRQAEAAEFDCSACFAEDIMEGVLCCGNSHLFPITSGVPRMMLDAWEVHDEFTVKWSEELRALSKSEAVVDQKTIADAVTATAGARKGFGREWALFRHGEDRTWGWDQETRRKRVLLETDMQPAQFNGSRVMDAGCGNGVLTSAIGDMGAEVIGVDISPSVNAAFVHNKNPHVHYVQGDLMNPPIRKHSLDLIYSSGVIHHTPNTELTFSCLVPLLRPGGRFYVWLYHPQANLKHRVMIRLRKVVCRMPSLVQNVIITMLTGYGVMKRCILRGLRMSDEPLLNWREQKINFYDGLTPPYRFEHTQDEVLRWFAKREFANARCTVEEEFGFGMYADWKPDFSDEKQISRTG